MDDKFELLEGYFNDGLWDKKRMRNAVIKGWITQEEFELIVKEVYTQ